MKARKKLYLHIGRPKVGSTALQTFLKTNREALLEQGLLYPKSAMHHGASHKLALVFQQDSPEFHAVADSSAAAIYQAMFDEAESCKANRIIASSENLFLVDPRKPAELLSKHADTTIICYVRRQDEVLISSLLQELKMGLLRSDLDVESYARDPERLRWLDYNQILESWSRAFGHKNIVVRVLEKSQIKGTIQEDLMSIAGSDMTGLQVSSTRDNPSPARDVLEFMQMLNDVSSGLPRLAMQVLQQRLLEASEMMGTPDKFNAKALVPTSLRKAILDKFRNSNAKVAEKYLGRRSGILFNDESMPARNEEDSYTGLELHRFAQMAAALLTQQQRQLFKLQIQINELKRRLQP